MAKYPIFLELSGRRVVVIGGGAVAARKAQVLLAAGARLVVVAERIDEILTVLCRDKSAEIVKSKYAKSYLAEAVLVVAATNNNQLNKQIYKDCQELEILCNVVDVPELCEAGDAAFTALEGVLQSCEQEGLLSRSVSDAGLLAWSAVHGAAFLLIDGRLQLGKPAPDSECVLNLIHESLWAGIGRR